MAHKRNTRAPTKNRAQFNEATTTRNNKNRNRSSVGKAASGISTASYGELCVFLLSAFLEDHHSHQNVVRAFIFIGSQLCMCKVFNPQPPTIRIHIFSLLLILLLYQKIIQFYPTGALEKYNQLKATEKKMLIIVYVLPQPPWGMTARYSYAFLQRKYSSVRR